MNAIHNNNDDNNKSMKDSTRHKNKDRRPKGELKDQQQQQQQPQSAKRVLSLTDFTNDEIRLLHHHRTKRDAAGSTKALVALAQRWDRFARDYKKTWRGGVPYSEEEEEEEEEEEGWNDERLNDEAFAVVRRIDIPEKNKYDGAFGLVHSDKAPKNKNKNDEKS